MWWRGGEGGGGEGVGEPEDEEGLEDGNEQHKVVT